MSELPLSAFDGSDYQQQRDGNRLTAQHETIKKLMLDGQWRTLDEIAKITKYPHASVSAQLRHLRKARFGGYTVEKQYKGNGLFAYRVIPPIPEAPQPPASNIDSSLSGTTHQQIQQI